MYSLDLQKLATAYIFVKEWGKILIWQNIVKRYK